MEGLKSALNGVTLIITLLITYLLSPLPFQVRVSYGNSLNEWGLTGILRMSGVGSCGNYPNEWGFARISAVCEVLLKPDQGLVL